MVFVIKYNSPNNFSLLQQNLSKCFAYIALEKNRLNIKLQEFKNDQK